MSLTLHATLPPSLHLLFFQGIEPVPEAPFLPLGQAVPGSTMYFLLMCTPLSKADANGHVQ